MCDALIVSLVNILAVASCGQLHIVVLFLSVFALATMTGTICRGCTNFSRARAAVLVRARVCGARLLSSIAQCFSFFASTKGFNSGVNFTTVLFNVSTVFMGRHSVEVCCTVVTIYSVCTLFVSKAHNTLFIPVKKVVLLAFLDGGVGLVKTAIFFKLFFCIFFTRACVNRDGASVEHVHATFEPAGSTSCVIHGRGRGELTRCLGCGPFKRKLNLKKMRTEGCNSHLAALVPRSSFCIGV